MAQGQIKGWDNTNGEWKKIAVTSDGRIKIKKG
jgi:hypothetical protein